MILLLSFCTLPWWLSWLLPFLLGLLVGWAIWSKYKSQVEDLNEDINALRAKISSLESDLDDCKRAGIDAKGEIADLETQLRKAKAELEAQAEASLEVGDAPAPEGPVDLGAAATGFVAGAVSGGAGAGDVDLYSGLPSDNLQILEGIGPKMESVLKENGITTWAALAAKSPAELREVLGNYGDRYRIIDPDTWPQQAAMARDRKWEELIVLQKELDTGKVGGSGDTDSKLEKMMIKLGLLRKYKQDDLKAIEGIGPKIEGLLHEAGITTWRELANTEVTRIQEILNAAGPRYKLADPGTWPRQAELAADGKFRELQQYQDELTGGR